MAVPVDRTVVLDSATPSAASTPSLDASFNAVNFNQDGNNSGYYHIPPDPIGAAGPTQVVSLVNTTIEWYTKTGVKQHAQGLASFFAALSPAAAKIFDPKVVYDPHADRFVVVALEHEATSLGDASNASRILVAVSNTSDPNAGWHVQAINSKLSISGNDTWADYPGLAVDGQAVYVTTNQFAFSNGAFLGERLWIVNKNPLYSGGTIAATAYNAFAGAGLAQYSVAMPTQIYGAGVGGSVGTFVVSAGWSGGSTDYLSVIRVDNPLTGPSFTNQFINLGDVDNTSVAVPAAPQNGTSQSIDAGDSRIQNVVWRNNQLLAVNTVVPPSGPDAGQATAHWYEIDTSALASLTLDDQGNIGGEDIASGTYTFYPSIAVDAAGDFAVGFAASAPGIYPAPTTRCTRPPTPPAPSSPAARWPPDKTTTTALSAATTAGATTVASRLTRRTI